jgi:glycosyltransferase involved in cell wall biosynthesis
LQRVILLNRAEVLPSFEQVPNPARKLRIAVWHNLPSGGGKRALYDHVRGLLELGHTVEAWCPPTADQTYLPLNDLIPEHVVPAKRQERSSNYSLSSLLGLRTHGLNKVIEIDGYARQSAQEINRGSFDLLFANSSSDVAVSSIGRYVNLPKILYLQEPARFLYEAEPHLPWMALPRRAWTPGHLAAMLHNAIRLRGHRIQLREEWLNARAFDRILVNSLYSRESVQRAYGLNASVCYLGVNNHKFVNRHLPREEFIVGLGSISPRKNIGLVIDALGCVPQPRPKLLWIGNSTTPVYLAELHESAQAAQVEFEPRLLIDDEAVIDLLNRARLMVYAPTLEPFGFAPLEANACGLPVIAVAEGGVRETVIDGVNGLLVESDPQSMAVAIAHLINNPAEAQRLGQQGCELVAERWTVKDAAKRLEQQLTRVISTTTTQ